MLALKTFDLICLKFSNRNDVFSEEQVNRIKDLSSRIDDFSFSRECRGLSVDYSKDKSEFIIGVMIDRATIEKDDSFWELCSLMLKVDIVAVGDENGDLENGVKFYFTFAV